MNTWDGKETILQMRCPKCFESLDVHLYITQATGPSATLRMVDHALAVDGPVISISRDALELLRQTLVEELCQ